MFFISGYDREKSSEEWQFRQQQQLNWLIGAFINVTELVIRNLGEMFKNQNQVTLSDRTTSLSIKIKSY